MAGSAVSVLATITAASAGAEQLLAVTGDTLGALLALAATHGNDRFAACALEVVLFAYMAPLAAHQAGSPEAAVALRCAEDPGAVVRARQLLVEGRLESLDARLIVQLLNYAAKASSSTCRALAESVPLVRAVAGMLAGGAEAGLPAAGLLATFATYGRLPAACAAVIMEDVRAPRALVKLMSDTGRLADVCAMHIITGLVVLSGVDGSVLQVFRRLPTMEGLAALIGHSLEAPHVRSVGHMSRALELAEVLEPDAQRLMAFWMRPGAASRSALGAITRLLRDPWPAGSEAFLLATRWLRAISTVTLQEPRPAEALLSLKQVLATPGLVEAAGAALDRVVSRERVAGGDTDSREVEIAVQLSRFLAVAVASAPSLLLASRSCSSCSHGWRPGRPTALPVQGFAPCPSQHALCLPRRKLCHRSPRTGRSARRPRPQAAARL